MPSLSQLKLYSQLYDEVMDVGPPSTNLDELLELANLVERPSTIAFVEGPALQQWKGLSHEPDDQA